jgi:site-specific DNA recombinase
LSKDTLHIYTRVSTTAQAEEGTSLKSQADAGRKYAKTRGFKVKLWNEGGQSSSKDDLINRPVLNELLEQISKGEVKHLYVWNTDRLSRNIQTWGMIRLILIQNDVHLHNPTGEQILTDPQTNLMLGILSEFSQYDNQIRAERSRIGKLNRVKDGEWHGGPTPFGYELGKNNKLVPNKTEAKAVRFIYESYSKGATQQQIADDLLKKGVLTRRGNAIWSDASLRLLLRNTHFGGYYFYTDKKSGETVRVECPAILPKGLIKKVATQVEKRSYGKGVRTDGIVKKRTYLLSGLLVCGECGKLFHGNFKNTTNSLSSYMCSSKTSKKKNEKKCTVKGRIPLEATDEQIMSLVLEVVKGSHLYKEEFKVKTLKSGSKKQSDAELKRIQKKIGAKSEDLAKVRESIVNFQVEKISGLVSNKEIAPILKGLQKKVDLLEDEIESLQKTLKGEEKDQKWVDWVNKFKDKLDSIALPETDVNLKQEFLEGLVKEVVVIPHSEPKTHKFKITFKQPYVGDKLIWKDKANKRKGYSIKAGKTHTDLEFESQRKARTAKKKI